MNKTSLDKLSTCDEQLQRLIRAVDLDYPVQVVYGHRNQEEQDRAFRLGNSKLQFPKSKHNKTPSLAVDIVPDPDRNPATIKWDDIEEFKKMLSVVEAKARELGIKIRLGKDFSFKDYPHVELV